MRRLLSLAVVIAATTILAACSAGGAAALTGKDWQLTAITEKVPAFQGVVPAAEQSKYTITFAHRPHLPRYGRLQPDRRHLQDPGIEWPDDRSRRRRRWSSAPKGRWPTCTSTPCPRAKTWAIANDTFTITLDDEGTLTFVVAAAPAQRAACPARPQRRPPPPPHRPRKPTAKPTTAPTAKPAATPTKAPAASAAPSSATGLLGKTWQLTTITEKVPAFQGVVPAARAAELHDRLRGRWHVQRQGRLQHGRRQVHGRRCECLIGFSRHRARPDDDGRLPGRVAVRPVHPGSLECRELRQRQRRIDDHAQGRRNARLQVIFERRRATMTKEHGARLAPLAGC